MASSLTSPVTARSRMMLDVGLALWTLVWAVVGVSVAVQLWQLSRVSDSLEGSGRALDTAGVALEVVGQLPVVGEGPDRLGREVRHAAAQIQRDADRARRNIRALSVTVGAAIVVLPVAPLAAIYLPDRWAERRDLRAVRRALEGGGDQRALEALLAHRAVRHLPVDVLLRVSADPHRDLDGGRHRRLANAELTRLGLAHRDRPPV